MDFLCGVIEGFYGTPWKTSERKELFARLKEIDLNTYMYAPKDDKKHRKLWRSLYNERECKILKNLIECATSHDIEFIYAISPGLDIVFTSLTDLNHLITKLKQVHSLGCKSFAILFDDIDPELCLADKTEFSSSGEAQTAITNKLFEWFDDLRIILFCPTEYCETRAKPDIVSSEYLKTLGEKLNNKVKILWTGPKVVSNYITCHSLENLTKVLQRKPVIWDNIHANDYDNRRVFLGPFKDRDLKLYSHTSGVLTNPNCDFHLNFMAIESLAVWKRNAAQLCSESAEQKVLLSGNVLYDPEQTLTGLCEKWMTFFQQERSVSLFHNRKNTNNLKLNSLIDDDVTGSDSEDARNSGTLSTEHIVDDDDDDEDSSEENDTKSGEKKRPFDVEDLVLLCHFFYLPYEEGERATEIVRQFKWLKLNAIDYTSPPIQQKIDKWHSRLAGFLKLCDEVSGMYNRFIRVKNKRIVQQLHPYATDVNDTVNLLKSFAKFLGSKERENGDSFVPEDPEAWRFRGGLLGEMERLIPVTNDDFLKDREIASKTVIIRPYHPEDKDELIGLYGKLSRTSSFTHEDKLLLFDSAFGAVLTHSTSHAFVMEVDDVICAAATGCCHAEMFYKDYEAQYLPKIQSKYNITATSPPTSLNLAVTFKRRQFVPSRNMLLAYPSVLVMEFLPRSELYVPKLLRCVVSLLRSNVHVVLFDVNKRTIEQYKDFGFKVLSSSNASKETVLGFEL